MVGLRVLRWAPHTSSVLRHSCRTGVGFRKSMRVFPGKPVQPAPAMWSPVVLGRKRAVCIREMTQPEVPPCSPLLCRPEAFIQVLVRPPGLASWGSPHMEGSATNRFARVVEGLALRTRPQSLGFLIPMLHSSGAGGSF